MSMTPSPSRDRVIEEIGKTEDKALRSVLTIMLGFFEELGHKIDDLRNDDEAMRKTVLEEFHEVHRVHHQFVDLTIKEREALAVEKRADDARRAWVDEQMEDERESLSSRRKIKGGVLQAVILLALGAGGSWLLYGMVHQLSGLLKLTP